ncbi:MAG: glycosyltransferase [Pseudomonadota bacterium]
MPALSIIVTSYNVEPYLSECLDGLIAQTLSDVEIIVVDDGSTDASPKIISDYAAKHAHIKPILMEENSPGGVGTAANVGMDAATGDYVGFADGDDVYDPTMFEKLLTAARTHDADLAFCRYDVLDSVTGERADPADEHRWRGLEGDLIELDEEGSKTILRFIAVPWRKIYRRTLLEDPKLRFPEGDYFFEDNPFHWFTVLSAKSIAVVPEKLCQHRVNRVGQTMATADEKLFKMFIHHGTIHAWLKQTGRLETYRSSLITWMISQMDWISRRTPPELRAKLFDAVRAQVKLYRMSEINAAIRSQSVGQLGCHLILAIKGDDLKRFNAALDGDIKMNLLQEAALHTRRFGLASTIGEARDLFGKWLNRHQKGARRLPVVRTLDKIVNGASYERAQIERKVDRLMAGQEIMDRRLRELEKRLDGS